ncbi:MarP family serine protease [Microbacterium sp. STN6]|uniref:MarP family serine protease n=1 Tax=Microbacterium sp. STN6 TaxID=2995588 RepID=UPI0022609C2E|nr:MarP family serine protease [Microbacterium sp. STN6]MCX7521151.1 MarP family serine protease [Microbacterium sp. STN6]
MSGSVILDIALVVVLIGYLFHGFRSGLVLSLGGIIGIVVGAIAAFFVIPLVNAAVADSAWRVAIVLLVAAILLGAGHALGSAVGRALRRGVHRTPLRVVDRVAGAAVDVVVAALLMSMLAFGISSLGIPPLSNAIGSSAVLKSINALTPAPVQQGLAQLRAFVVKDATGRVIDIVSPSAPSTPPDIDTDTPALTKAARSVVKITGVAFACSQTQSGSGFVVAPGRVVTNAHVVAGVSQPVVQAPDGSSRTGRIVYFDPKHDLAVIAVDGLGTPALPLAQTLKDGDSAVFDGYPLGGPFQSKPAAVRSVADASVQDIYKSSQTTMEIYTLAADVQQGNSGGPLLTRSGAVAGVVFATSADDRPIGYALAMSVLGPVAQGAASDTTTADSGHCTRG